MQSQSDLGIGLLADARFNPEGTFTFQIRDAFTRSVRHARNVPCVTGMVRARRTQFGDAPDENVL